MGRKHKHSILIYGPAGTAKRTIQHLKEKYRQAQSNPEVRREWVDKYFKDIGDYIDNPERTKEAEEKLGTWYEVLVSNVAPEFARAMQKAKAVYYRKLAEKLGESSAEENEASEFTL
ncbi:hypothetical protein [Saccharolobus shibatae]|uniref:Uncharacterized protein n=1 Tax=Saccharolobus shibatae TaxID=2286 RepID=A0A8F5H2V4_9CREN|nr:hypothetical protein [Saccharolobus shibatae]QXJ36587.1 hypothetical protein J5U22_03164 [Saccharolobus shibatae]